MRISFIILMLSTTAVFADGSCRAGWTQTGTMCCNHNSANLRSAPCYALPSATPPTTSPPPVPQPARSVNIKMIPINDALMPIPIEQGLPKNPGTAGDATVDGVDSNGDGVRDDVERAIFYAWPKNPKAQNVGFELAKNYQALLVANPSAADMEKYIVAIAGWSQCLDSLTATEDADETVIVPIMFDTPARVAAYTDAMDRWEASRNLILPMPAVNCP